MRHLMQTAAAWGLMRLALAMEWLNFLLCSLHGHDAVLAFGPREVFLRCATCGRRTAGWQLGNPPVVKFTGDPRRHQGAVPLRVPVVVADSPAGRAALGRLRDALLGQAGRLVRPGGTPSLVH